MAGKRKGLPPSYPSKPHRSGQARITATQTNGSRRCVLLGKWGSPESQEAYSTLLKTLAAHGGKYPCGLAGVPEDGLTVAEVAAAYRNHAREACKRTDGSRSRNIDHFRAVLLAFVDLHGGLPMPRVGGREVLAFRDHLEQLRSYLVRPADGSSPPRRLPASKVRLRGEHLPSDQALFGAEWKAATVVEEAPALAVGTINQRLRYLGQFVEWAALHGHAARDLRAEVAAVGRLKEGHGGRPTRPAVRPASEPDVEATLRLVAPQVAAMARLQLLTGMRPGEVCLLRGVHVRDRDGDVWKIVFDPCMAATEQRPEYRLSHLHKTDRCRGADGKPWVRQIPLGPAAQEVIKRWLRADETEFLFRPDEVGRRGRASCGAAPDCAPAPAATPRRGGGRSSGRASRAPRDHYDPHSYCRALVRAARKAGVAPWSPNRLRHSVATKVRRDQGTEAAQAVLGHKQLRSTERYAAPDVTLAETVARRM